ncbi:hypothetical protein E2C01_030187 [Portunus trituberculatus]|uniref:Uncharacterized protein n=1 Tax=Portunus trituberculatus TaxID=210409 RepID=A0A5B7EUP1_PORTR|nr:hypothetical protein [Portunus trituberculatus]
MRERMGELPLSTVFRSATWISSVYTPEERLAHEMISDIFRTPSNNDVATVSIRVTVMEPRLRICIRLNGRRRAEEMNEFNFVVRKDRHSVSVTHADI